MTETTIRLAQRNEDMGPLRALMVALQDRQRQENPDLPTGEELVDGYLKYMWRRIDKHRGQLILAEQGGQLVGFLSVLTHKPRREPDDPAKEHAEIAELYVDPQVRGQGIARRLVDRAAECAREAAVAELRVGAAADNQAVAQLYGHLGFRPLMTLYGKKVL